jgi:hypothetical protein
MIAASIRCPTAGAAKSVKKYNFGQLAHVSSVHAALQLATLQLCIESVVPDLFSWRPWCLGGLPFVFSDGSWRLRWRVVVKAAIQAHSYLPGLVPHGS